MNSTVRLNAMTRPKLPGTLINDILEFVYPDNESHPKTAARLYAFAFYGPAKRDKKGRLRLHGGYKKQHQLVDHEVKILLQRIEDEFVHEIYLVSILSFWISIQIHQTNLTNLPLFFYTEYKDSITATIIRIEKKCSFRY